MIFKSMVLYRLELAYRESSTQPVFRQAKSVTGKEKATEVKANEPPPPGKKGPGRPRKEIQKVESGKTGKAQPLKKTGK